MHRRHVLKTIAGLALCPLCTTRGLAAEHHPHWSYEGAAGPNNWGHTYNTCKIGNQQSPVDIASTIKAELPGLEMAWAKNADTIVNNGHTIQLDFADGGSLKVGSDSYKLKQFHFHHPSEHLIDGKRSAMEAHFVHAGAGDALAVIGVMMMAGKPNAVFNKIVTTMPKKEGPPVKADPAIDPSGLLPGGRAYYRYAGSLTTPPCSETVAWMVLTDPLEVAEADIAAFAKLFPDDARPPQKLNRRFLLRS
jgi:carbonic anhydrase